MSIGSRALGTEPPLSLQKPHIPGLNGLSAAHSGFQQHVVTTAHLIIIEEQFQGITTASPLGCIQVNVPRASVSSLSVSKAVSGLRRTHRSFWHPSLPLSGPHPVRNLPLLQELPPSASLSPPTLGFWRAEICSDDLSGALQPASAVESFR